MTDVIRKLPLSFTRFAVFGSSDTTNVRWPMASNTGDNASIVAGSPAATTNSLAACAASGLPNTGAATNFWPASACAAVKRSASATLMVEADTWVAPTARDATMPSSPNVTPATASSLASMVKTTSPRHASATESAGRAPSETSASTFGLDRL